MLTLYRDNSLYRRKEKYKRDMQRPGFLGEENKSEQKSYIISKFPFFLLTFSDEYDIAELVGDMPVICR